MTDTIFALSSGAPPAAIAVVRISGPGARTALGALAGRVPPERRAVSTTLRDGDGNVIDRVLALWLPGPATATGEDTAELHCHGGRAVVAAVTSALAGTPGLRAAQPGEFTRRAFVNGRVDLAEAEGLADLLEAETELQRRAAIAMATGAFSAQVDGWRDQLLQLSAAVEAVLDFADEDDVAALPANFHTKLSDLLKDLREWLDRPRAEHLRDGFRVVLSGPPNSGKSTLFNALIGSDAAITAPSAGTTRDVLERAVGLEGIPFTFVDTAGLRSEAGDEIEAIGIARARSAADRADLVLWLGDEGEGPPTSWEIEPQCDRTGHLSKVAPRHRVSAVTGSGIAALCRDLAATARSAMPRLGEAALNARQHRLLDEAAQALAGAERSADPLLTGENLRVARLAFDALLGRTGVEDMLDALFGRFCIGK